MEAPARFEGAADISALLNALTEAMVTGLPCDACLVSRAIGDMLVDLVEHSPGRELPGGHGYLISDYPATQRVLREQNGEVVDLDDRDADAQEVRLLRTLGFTSLLMQPIVVDGATWGLVEAYRDRRFTDEDAARVAPLIGRAAELIPRLQS